MEREDSFGGLIRRAVPATLNVGYTGHGPLSELGALREYVASRRPAHVLWFFYEGNDLSDDLPRELESPILRRYLEPGFEQHLEQRASALDAESRRHFEARLAAFAPEIQTPPLVAAARLESLRAMVARVGFSHAGARPARPLAELRHVLAEASRTVAAWGGMLHFVYLPDLPCVLDSCDSSDRYRVIAVATGLGLPVIDLSDDFRRHPSRRSLFPFDQGRHLIRTRGLHYSSEGHRLVAKRALEELGLVHGDSRSTGAEQAGAKWQP